jgi:hypothetical protein
MNFDTVHIGDVLAFTILKNTFRIIRILSDQNRCLYDVSSVKTQGGYSSLLNTSLADI